jgi:arsenite methyltransferase
MTDREIREAVRQHYGDAAKQSSSCCSGSQSTCCGATGGDPIGETRRPAEEVGKAIGYSDEELASAPEGSNLGLGCGNPLGLAAIRDGDTVLDLGSGAGFDCFLAASRVGYGGRVIGVDMTPNMLEKARENAEAGSYRNVEFRLGEIENLPVADDSVDLVISNCVINLSTRKDRVFREAYRVLKPGGRIMISDMVLLRPLPEEIRTSLAAYAGCIAGASLKDDYLALIREAGFADVAVEKETGYLEKNAGQPCCADGKDGKDGEDEITAETVEQKVGQIAGGISSISVSARKPVE